MPFLKKIFRFLRSMVFGMILLGLIILCCLAGSLIPQGESEMTYVRQYGSGTAMLFLSLGFTDIFHTWYFTVLEALLCGNLILCSILRFPAARKTMAGLKAQAEHADPAQEHPLEPGGAETVLAALKRARFRGNDRILTRNGIGACGSFLVHLSILVILLFGTLTLTTPVTQDVTVMPGETFTLADGTTVTCLSFRIQDETGRLDYASRIRVASPGEETGAEAEIRVNEPLRHGGTKVYQYTYGTKPVIRVTNTASGAEESFYVDAGDFLSIDGRNGLIFDALHPGYILNEDGTYTLITSSAMSYADPVYDVRTVSDGSITSVLAFPGETITIGDIGYTMADPVEYPGLRIKQTAPVLYAGLYFGFGLMIAALFLCFFMVPACARVEENGFVIRSAKPQDALLDEIAIALDGTDKKGDAP